MDYEYIYDFTTGLDLQIFIIIVTSILSLWYFLRYLNGKFDAGELNENDREYRENRETKGSLVARGKEIIRIGKKFLKK